MIRSFLPGRFHKIFIALMAIFILLGLFSLLLFTLFVYGFMYFLYRKTTTLNLHESEVEDGAIFSPVSGRVVKIEHGVSHSLFGEDYTMIRITVPWWNEFGIYLPCASEVKDVTLERSLDEYRYKKNLDNLSEPNGLCVTLENKQSDEIGMQFIKCPLGLDPEIGVLPGDRGKLRGSIGYFLLGGTVLLYIPENYKIMVSEKDILTAGSTIIGGE